MGIAFPSFSVGEGELFSVKNSLPCASLSFHLPPQHQSTTEKVLTIAWDFVIPPLLSFTQQQQQEQGFSTCGDPGLTRLQDQDQE